MRARLHILRVKLRLWRLGSLKLTWRGWAGTERGIETANALHAALLEE